jgi:hypothetical protein
MTPEGLVHGFKLQAGMFCEVLNGKHIGYDSRDPLKIHRGDSAPQPIAEAAFKSLQNFSAQMGTHPNLSHR